MRTIDELWLEYSRGKFGISVQQEIYRSLVNGYMEEYMYYTSDTRGTVG
ncbi:MAG: GUN4 domain-containing protein [Cylindrospermopsis raciborskii]